MYPAPLPVNRYVPSDTHRSPLVGGHLWGEEKSVDQMVLNSQGYSFCATGNTQLGQATPNRASLFLSLLKAELKATLRCVLKPFVVTALAGKERLEPVLGGIL
jgi:hypothetical protein